MGDPNKKKGLNDWLNEPKEQNPTDKKPPREQHDFEIKDPTDQPTPDTDPSTTQQAGEKIERSIRKNIEKQGVGSKKTWALPNLRGIAASEQKNLDYIRRRNHMPAIAKMVHFLPLLKTHLVPLSNRQRQSIQRSIKLNRPFSDIPALKPLLDAVGDKKFPLTNQEVEAPLTAFFAKIQSRRDWQQVKKTLSVTTQNDVLLTLEPLKRSYTDQIIPFPSPIMEMFYTFRGDLGQSGSKDGGGVNL